MPKNNNDDSDDEDYYPTTEELLLYFPINIPRPPHSSKNNNPSNQSTNQSSNNNNNHPIEPEHKRKKKPVPKSVSEKYKVIFDKKCETLSDLIEIGKAYNNLINEYPDVTHKDLHMDEYPFISISKIAKMEKELNDINQMIGMEKIKSQFVAQISYLLSECKQDMLMHTLITGPPGHGKTEIAKLIGKAYHKSGILKSNAFVCASRKQLVGRYLGQTAGDTTSMFDKARGGVIFIDEIYALGSSSSEVDSYSKEAVDTINQLLSERMDTMCIIAGYEHEVEECFFKINPGLRSRFPWRFDIEQYDGEQLFSIFQLYLTKGGWTLDKDAKIVCPEFFKENAKYFKDAGRDIFSLFTKCSIQHTLRLFLKASNKVFTNADLEKGITVYKEHKKIDDSEDMSRSHHFSMYT